MLDAHPAIAIPLDTVGLWDRYEKRLPEYGDLSIGRTRRRIVEDVLREERIRLWETPLSPDDVLARWKESEYPGLVRAFHESYAAAKGKQRWGDKDPGNMTRIDQLNRWFPDSRFIHIIRDGRDACLSQLKQDFGFNNLFECAAAWREEVQWVRRMGRILGDRYHELRYEELVAEPHRELRAIARFLGIEFSDSMMKYHERGAAVPEEKRHLWPLLSKPPQADNAERWKHTLSAGDRICFEKRAGTVLQDMGYEVLPGRASGAYWTELRNLTSSAWRALRRRFGGR